MRGSTRAGLGVMVLVLLWIFVYWWYMPAAGGEERTLDPAVLTPQASDVAPSEPGPGEQAKEPATSGTPAPKPPDAGLNPGAGAGGSAPGATGPGGAAPSPTTATQQPAASAPAPGTVIPPTFDLYRVVKGDDAQTISLKRYGTRSHWRSVLRANPLKDFTRLKPGDVVNVPRDPGNVQGVEVKPEPADFVDYVVVDGDTLSGIATALYGKQTMWKAIRDANKDVINEEGTNLRPGMKLKVPPPTSGAKAGSR